MRHVTIQAPLPGKTFIIQLETWSTEATNSIAKEYIASVEHLEHCICSEPLFSRLDSLRYVRLNLKRVF